MTGFVPEPPKIREFSFPANLSPGDTVVVNCVVKKGSSGPFELTWRKDGVPVQPTETLTVASHKGGPLSALSIVDLAAEDSGNYTCVARNAIGNEEFSAYLAVKGPPRLLEFAFPPDVSLGDEIIVPCVVKKDTAGPYRIAWQKDGVDLRENADRVSVSYPNTKRSSTLSIASLQPEDVGNYTCSASNSFGSDSFTAALVVHDGPKIKEFEFPTNLSPGDTVAVVCLIQKGSSGPYELSWRKDDRPVVPSASLTVTSSKGGPTSTLTIADVSARDSGNYSCVARNAAGSDRVTAYLAVTGIACNFPVV
ncbi:hypothetical protein MRX96_050897 [Rhipicephalus microplus]